LNERPQQPDAVRNECRRQRVAGITCVVTAIERKTVAAADGRRGLRSPGELLCTASLALTGGPRLPRQGSRGKSDAYACRVDDEPGVAAGGVEPQLAVRTGRVFAQVHVFVSGRSASAAAGRCRRTSGRCSVASPW
jgi:hypothetical protein